MKILEAAIRGDAKLVGALVSQGAQVDVTNQVGWTPLLMAAEGGHLEVVRLLGESLGANVNQASQVGWAPLLMAAEGGHL